MAVTWQNVKDMFYETIGDNETNAQLFTSTEVVAFADEAMREAAMRTRYCDYYEAQLSNPGAVSTSVYYLSATRNFQIWRVEYAGQKLLPISTAAVRNGDVLWASRTGTPRFYMLDEYQTDTDATAVRLFETPAVDDEDIEFYAYGIQIIINDSEPTQNLNIPEWFAYALLFGMLERAYEVDSEIQSFEKSQFYHMMWEDAIGRLRIRSTTRLPKLWAMKPQGSGRKFSIKNRIPLNIPEP